MILAAGRGVRMKSALPKVLHRAAGRPLIDRVLRTAAEIGSSASTEVRVVVVVGAGRDRVAAHLATVAPEAALAVQDPPLGTGDAVRVALLALEGSPTSEVVVLSGDVPLLGVETIARLVAARRDAQAAVAFLTARLLDPAAYGRVVRDGRGEVVRIVEAKDATEAERALDEINAGVYVFDRAFLEAALPRLTTDNRSGELYLTDVLGLAVKDGRRALGVPVKGAEEILGINSRSELAEVDGILRRRAADAAMAAGATLMRPETITLDDTVVLDPDVVVEPFTSLYGRTRAGGGTRIGQGSVIADSTLGRNVTIRPYCVLESARVGDGAVVGPFARLREGTELAEDVHVGNFVETKKARLAKGVKANHLTYLGDTVIGERTNVGAGVITCNYDGFTKHVTTIGADVFVGSDVQLVAPVNVADGAMIGAGTTVTDDVPADAMALSRAPQVNLEGAATLYRERKRAPRAGK